MRKVISVAVAAFILLGIVIFTSGIAYSNLEHPEDIIGGGGGVVTWKRDTNQCPFAYFHTEVICTKGGDQQCTTQNCP